MRDVDCFYDGSPSELSMREMVRHSVGYELTEMSVASAMRVHTPHSYRCAVMKDSTAPAALLTSPTLTKAWWLKRGPAQ